MLIPVNVVNFDYLIYHVRKPTTGQGVDREYLSRLASDSLSYKDQLTELTKNSFPSPTEVDKEKALAHGLWVVLYKIDRLQEKYKDLDIRSFNLMEYLQYKQIESVDTQPYRSTY